MENKMKKIDVIELNGDKRFRCTHCNMMSFSTDLSPEFIQHRAGCPNSILSIEETSEIILERLGKA